MAFFDSSEFDDHFFHHVGEGGLSFFVFGGNDDYFLLFDLFLNDLLNLNQFGEGNPFID